MAGRPPRSAQRRAAARRRPATAAKTPTSQAGHSHSHHAPARHQPTSKKAPEPRKTTADRFLLTRFFFSSSPWSALGPLFCLLASSSPVLRGSEQQPGTTSSTGACAVAPHDWLRPAAHFPHHPPPPIRRQRRGAWCALLLLGCSLAAALLPRSLALLPPPWFSAYYASLAHRRSSKQRTRTADSQLSAQNCCYALLLLRGHARAPPPA